ncbi:ROK family protein [candidate division KSB1 bacterium]|nr:ROK family protein [candidate division KSB1 bacterium]
MNERTDSVLGIDIGGTKCAVSLGDRSGNTIDKLAFPTREPEGPGQAIENLLGAAEQLIERHPECALLGTGISCGSPLDPERGIIQSPANLQSWIDVPIVRIFEDRFKFPAFLENDANAGALAEHRFGAGRGYRHLVFITFGTGFGSGLILNNQLYRGATTYAGEIGHVRLNERGPVGCRKHGSAEGFCSGGGIARLARYRLRQKFDSTPEFHTTLAPGGTIPHDLTTEQIANAAKAGDPFAREIFEISGRYLGRALAILLDILNPEVIIIGSIFVRCESLLRPSMQTELEKEALPQTLAACKIVAAQLDERIGDLAAQSIAWSNI